MVVEEDKKIDVSTLICFIFAFISVALYFFSPFYFIYKYEHKYLDLKSIPFLQIFFNALNCTVYVVAALSNTGDFQNLLTNITCLLICIFILLKLFIVINKGNESSTYFIYLLIIFNIIFQIGYYIYRSDDDEGYLTQYSAIIINILMYLSLNQNDISAFKEKRPDKIPILSCCLGLLSSLGWLFYAMLSSDENSYEEQSEDITFYANLFSFFTLITPIVEYLFLFIKYKDEINRYSINNANSVNSPNNKDMNKDLAAENKDKLIN